MKNPFLPFICCLVIFLSCEEYELLIPQQDLKPIEQIDKAANECSFDENTNQAHLVEFCGTDYFFHVSLRLSNQGAFHRVQAVARCYKVGGDPTDYIDFGEIEVEVNGNMHVWCHIPIDIEVPGDYNKELVNGQVPFREHCDDCGFNLVTLDYFKNITLIKPQDIVKANFRLKLSGCGEIVEKFITLQI